MESGLILGWLKKEGDTVVKGENLVEVESDKSNVAVEAQLSGTLIKIVHGSGEEVPCGQVIAYMGLPGEELLTPLQQTKANEQRRVPSASPDVPEPDEVESRPAQNVLPGRVIASPRARKTAREHGVNITQIDSGSGAGGRIEEQDVLRFLESNRTKQSSIKASPLAQKVAAQHGLDLAAVRGSSAGGRITREDVQKAVQHKTGERGSGSQELPVSKIRSRIAERLSSSFFSAPHYYLNLSADMEQLLACRQAPRAGKASERVPSINALLAKIVAPLLIKHPLVNASWQGERILLFQHVDIGFAVATDEGLITPVIRRCEEKSVKEIDEELVQLVLKAKEGKLLPADYQDNTFTITNLGMFDIESFTAIINPPASAILAVGKIIKKPVVSGDELTIRPMAELVLGCDHRVIDGAVGAAFLKDLKSWLELPLLMGMTLGKW